MAPSPRILFVHAGGRRERLAQAEQGVPMAQEFFYGLPQLRKLGLDVDLIETSDLAPDRRSLRYRWAARKDQRRGRLLGMEHCERLFLDRSIRLADYDVVIAGTEYVALGLVDHLRRCKGAPRLFFFVMGMLSKPLLRFADGSREQRRALSRYRALLECSHQALFLGRGEYEVAVQRFPDLFDRLTFMPFGVDTDFWTPADGISDGPILFVGNDLRRDVDMLLQIARAMPDQNFVALTSLLEGREVPSNLEVIVSNWKSAILSDEEVRAHYRKAAVVVLPIKETWQPSGQSVALQAMACGRPVVISDFSGFWQPEAFRDGEEIFFVSPNTAPAFVAVLSQVLARPEAVAKVAAQARLLLLREYTLGAFAKRLAHLIDAAAGTDAELAPDPAITHTKAQT